jgi:hypothetical protein
MQGKISIIRNSNNTIKIELEDELSSARFLDIEMTPENFALAVTNLSCIDCEYEVRALSVIGKRLEVKTEMIELGSVNYQNFKGEIYNLVKPYEVDGWQADGYVLSHWNDHNAVGNKYKITFRRYIKTDKT